MDLSIALLFILSLLQGIVATDFYITQPWGETVWCAGTTVKITWKVYPDVGPEACGINIDLMDGDDMAANFLLNIAHNIPVSSTCYEWYIPKTVSSSDRVFIRLTGIGAVPNYRFSHRFTITGGEGPGVTVIAIPGGTTIDVNSLISQLPPASKPTGYPAVVTLIDPNMSVTETTVTITSSGANRDRSTSSANTSKFSVACVAILMAAIFLW